MDEQPWIVVANWKMNKTIQSATLFVETIMPQVEGIKNPLWIASPFTALHPLMQMKNQYRFVLGAQNMNDATEGAFTGEIAAAMLKEVGASFVLLGHSERRIIFQESDEFIAKKVVRAIESGLTPLLCIGETFEEKQSGRTEEVLERQLSSVLETIGLGRVPEILVAYEPVWAIGTGLRPHNEDIVQAIQTIDLAVSRFQMKARVLYGGSVNVKNVEEIARIPSLSGLLVGGASLETDSFAKIALMSENRRNSL